MKYLITIILFFCYSVHSKTIWISETCADHVNCIRSICSVDITNSNGHDETTRTLFSFDRQKPVCDEMALGVLSLRAGDCFEYDLETGGKRHFLRCGKSKQATLATHYELLSPESGIIDYLSSIVAGNSCYEVDENGGSVYRQKVEDHFCKTENISEIDRNKSKIVKKIDDVNSTSENAEAISK